MSQRRRAIRNAFVVTIASGAAVVGCVNDVTRFDNDAPCPAAQPAHGDSCVSDQTCIYDYCGSDVIARCDGQSWSLEYTATCNPPPPMCPETEPAEGSACSQPGISCDFGLDDCDNPIVYDCIDGAWSQELWSCNPPPPSLCFDYLDPSTCAADPGCQWLYAGCADPMGPPAITDGCYPMTVCTSSIDCGIDEACTTAVYNPCHDEPCDACGAEIQVCTLIN